MADSYILKLFNGQIAEKYLVLKKIISKLQRSASSIGFVKQALYHDFTPTFAKVSGQFHNPKEKKRVETKLMQRQIIEHYKTLHSLVIQKRDHENELLSLVGDTLLTMMKRTLLTALRHNNLDQLKTKNNKISRLKPRKSSQASYRVPIINLSGFNLDTSSLNYGLHHSFVDKSRYIKRDLAVEFESLAASIDKFVPQQEKEIFHQFLRNTTTSLTQNVFHTRDNVYMSTKALRENDNIVILSGDKDSSVIILNKADYREKINTMLAEGIEQGKYVRTEDNILKELKSFQSYLYRHFKNLPQYEKIRPSKHQPARFFATAKTHKFDNINDIDLNKLKLRPIIDQTGTCYYDAGKFIANYLKPLTQNEFLITNTQDFPSMLKNIPLSEDEEDVSYDVESLFTSIPIKETIDFICDEIYTKKKLPTICKRSIFVKLLYKLTTECTFSANGELFKQTD